MRWSVGTLTENCMDETGVWWAVSPDNVLFLFDAKEDAEAYAARQVEALQPNADGELPRRDEKTWRLHAGRVRWGKLQTLGQALIGPNIEHGKDENCREGSWEDDGRSDPECQVCLSEYEALVGELKLVTVA